MWAFWGRFLTLEMLQTEGLIKVTPFSWALVFSSVKRRLFFKLKMISKAHSSSIFFLPVQIFIHSTLTKSRTLWSAILKSTTGIRISPRVPRKIQRRERNWTDSRTETKSQSLSPEISWFTHRSLNICHHSMRQNSQPTHWSSSQHPATERSTCTVSTNPVTPWGGNYCGPIFRIRKLRSKKISNLLMGVREGGKIQMQAARPHARGSKNSHENNSFHFKSPFQ